MKTLSKTAEAVFRAAIARVQEQQENGTEDPWRIGKPGGSIMPLCVEHIGEVPTPKSIAGEAPPFALYSFAHYYEQNGDMMRDPDITMIDTPAGLIPISYRQDGLGINNTYVAYDDRGVITGFMPKAQADLAKFCTDWARNLKDQQGL
jgi:hypothetical protein